MKTQNEKCRYCDYSGEPVIEISSNSVHYAKASCGQCGRMLRWIPKPDSDPTKYKRPAAHQDLVAKYGRGFCEMCLQKESELVGQNVLSAHHVQEFKNGGEEKQENIWIVCLACSRLIHWVRTYHGTVQTVGEVLKQWPAENHA